MLPFPTGFIGATGARVISTRLEVDGTTETERAPGTAVVGGRRGRVPVVLGKRGILGRESRRYGVGGLPISNTCKGSENKTMAKNSLYGLQN